MVCYEKQEWREKCDEGECIWGRGLYEMEFNLTLQLSLGKEDHHCSLLSSLLGRGALSSNALDELSLGMSLQDPTVKPGSALPQGVPWVQTQTEVCPSLRDCLIQYLFVTLLKAFSSPLKVSESWFPSWWASTKAKPP